MQEKLLKLVCLAIQGLDIDGIRVDKVTQMTVDFITFKLGPYVRSCAAEVNKTNFFLPGEITSGLDFGKVYLGRGIAPGQVSLTVNEALSRSQNKSNIYTMRSTPNYGLDSAAFSYSIYRGFLDFLGLRGNLLAPYDVGADPIESYNSFLKKIDYTNAYTGAFDPRDMWGVGNQDTHRWASLTDGLDRFRLGQVITSLILPGMPLVSSF